MKRFLRTIICALLILTVVILPAMPQASASSKVYLMKVVGSDVRLRDGPASSYSVRKKLANGTEVFYFGSSKAGFYKVTTTGGVTGYVYKDYLKQVGKYAKKSVYKVSSKTYLYSKASIKARHSTLRKGTYVLLSKKKSGWAYVTTLAGKKGYVKTGKIKKAF